jgi:restriction endonuclease S subunit
MMAVWSVVNISQLTGAFRLDAEFWQPNYLAAERAIQKLPHNSLGELVTSIRKGVFNILAESYVDHGIPFYRSSNVGQIIPKETGLAFITKEKHASESKTGLGRGDIMLAKTGKEAASVVLCDECNVSQDVIAIRVDRAKVNPFYLAVFLNTNAGMSQMRRWFQGQVQLHMSLPDARQILVPLPTEHFQKQIQNRVNQAERELDSALEEMSEAENLMLSALGLDRLDSSPSLFFERPFADLIAEERFDADYFSPRYRQILKRLAKDNLTIGGVASLATRKFQPNRHRNGDTFRYIEIGSLTRDGQAEPEETQIAEAPSRAKWIAEAGDVITSTVRPIRRLSAIVSAEQDGVVCSSGFAVLHVAVDVIEPEVLLTYLRLPMICEVLDLHTTASMYPAIPTDRLLKIPITLPSQATRSEIVARVRKSFAARHRASSLLEQAKSDVEHLILDPAKE